MQLPEHRIGDPIAIRAVAAGSLSAALDRPLETAHPAARDFARAEPAECVAAADRGALSAEELAAVDAPRG